MDKPGLVDYLIAPLTWVERARGWKRGALLLVYALATLIVGLITWERLSLWGLPDIGEPFDVDRLGSIVVPDAENATSLYQKALGKLIAATPTNYLTASSRAWSNTDWATAEPEVQRWVVDNRPALADWLEGTERPDALFVQPREISSATIRMSAYQLGDFVHLALLEASRRDNNGDLVGTWRMYRAALRSSRHAGMHGGPTQRHVGFSILSACRPHVGRWAEDLRVTAEMLHEAIADLEACKAMTSPASATIQAEYFASKAALESSHGWKRRRLGGPEGEDSWYNHLALLPEARQFFSREPERSLRILKLITAGQLAQCDRPPGDRAKLSSAKFRIYEVDSRTPKAIAAIAPEELTAWAERSAYSQIADQSGFLAGRIDSESGIFDTLLIRMAERAFELEHRKPPRTYADLLGPYLKTLPVGIEPGDRVSAASSPD